MRDQIGRYQIITDRRELMLPACSYFNRSDSDNLWIDTDTDGDEGRIYVGRSDAEAFAKLIGWGPVDKEMELENIELKGQVNDLRSTLRRVNMLLGGVGIVAAAENNEGRSTEPGADSGAVPTSKRRRIEPDSSEVDGGVSETI